MPKYYADHTFNFLLVRAKFDFMRVINAPCSTLREEDDTWDFVHVTGSSNSIFEETYTLRGDCSRYDEISIPVNRNIKEGEELFIDYGADYNNE